MTVALGFASPARAALLTINDTFGGATVVWTLDVTAGCTTCTVTLTAQVPNPAGAFAGTFIDSVQWTIAGTDISTINDQNGGAAGNVTGPLGGGVTSWTAIEGSLNANQCGGGANDNVCAASNTALGTGGLTNGQTLTWTFSVTFASALPSNLTGVEGNIRAAYNNPDGSNYHIFSPDNGVFGGTGAGTGGGTGVTLVPEPTSLLLFGTGLSMAAYRARRRKQNEKKN
jgi:hypothetical protein